MLLELFFLSSLDWSKSTVAHIFSLYMVSMPQSIHIISSALIISRSTQRDSLTMVKEESVLRHWLTDEIYSLLLVGKPGPTQSLRLCHGQTLAICYHSHSHWSIFTGPTFQEIIFSEMSLMTSRSCILLWSVPVIFGIPIYVASTKLKSCCWGDRSIFRTGMVD